MIRAKALFLLLFFFFTACANNADSATTSSVNPTPVKQATLSPTSATPLPTPTASPNPAPWETGHLIYAYITEGQNTSIVHVVSSGKESDFAVDGVSGPNLDGNLISISPLGTSLVVEVSRNHVTSLLYIDLTDPKSTPTILETLPSNSALTRLGFSPTGKWAFAVYDANANGSTFEPRSRIYDMTSQSLASQISRCTNVYGFSTDEENVYCSTTICTNCPGPVEFNIKNPVEEKPFFSIPAGKSMQVSQTILYPLAFLFDQNKAILGSQGFESSSRLLLVDNLTTLGAKSVWYASDIKEVAAQPEIADLSQAEEPDLFQFLPSPDGDTLAITGEYSTGGGGLCVSPHTFTFLTKPGKTIHPSSRSDLINGIYALAWSPDGKYLIAIIPKANSCNLSIVDPFTMKEVAIVSSAMENSARFWSKYVRGLDAIWISN